LLRAPSALGARTDLEVWDRTEGKVVAVMIVAAPDVIFMPLTLYTLYLIMKTITEGICISASLFSIVAGMTFVSAFCKSSTI
jgi:hypothetical protein